MYYLLPIAWLQQCIQNNTLIMYRSIAVFIIIINQTIFGTLWLQKPDKVDILLIGHFQNHDL